ncbi:hypothetical protein BDV25DRAFT_72023 [Aspergillus avenaceus]|uniref:Cora-like Mg2+ transporter protein-domain-containing protein n=1 Tax=Aspergillus avenaceus TaxID=36643 RepID=A0A5N6U170_ASPAV|nr:hypothetical protein BDV25DRAFT_72023 [Aspergillus avenaceus]
MAREILEPPEKAVVVNEYEINQWNEDTPFNLEEYLSTTPRFNTQLIFTSHKILHNCATDLDFPPEFESTLRDDVNGSSHTEYSFTGNALTKYKSWAIFKLKVVEKPKEYFWLQPSVFVEWDIPQGSDPGRQRVYFIGFPETNQKHIRANLPSHDKRAYNPYTWHTVFANEVVKLYDDCFWHLRNVVRPIEKARDDKTPPPPDFPMLHDVARHIFHSTEILEVAEHTMTNLVAEVSAWPSEFRDLAAQAQGGAFLQTRQRLLFLAKETHSHLTRSRSLSERLGNEINLAFNLVSQGYGRNAQSDSAMMRTIGVVSLIYLPGTFVSGIFGTNFFDFDSEKPDNWVMADSFWLYWAVTLPLTLATVVVWALWHFRAAWMGRVEKAKSKPTSRFKSRSGSGNGDIDLENLSQNLDRR